MDEEVVCGSNLVESEGDRSEKLCPMYFGVSCALFALRVLSVGHENGEDERWCEVYDKMLQGSAQLLGLLVWRAQRRGCDELLRKVEVVEREVEELKKQRREDAKANEKVVSIFASQEQSWFGERKRLRQHVGCLMNELRVVEKKKNEVISDLNEKLKGMEDLVKSKDKMLEDEAQKRKELEDRIKEAESVAEKLRETVKKEAQDHSNELWKHKTAFIELVSNQRQLEAELGRAQRQVEATKQELSLVLEQKEGSVSLAQKLSLEMVKMRKDLDQKEKVLSAMLRKSKLDTAEKQILLKEVKLSKAKRKQAELETERWKAVTESRHERQSLKSMFSRDHVNLRLDVSSGGRGASHSGKTRSLPTNYIIEAEHQDPELKCEPSPNSGYYSTEVNEDLVDVKRLESWVRLEAEKCASVMEQRHHLELEAFAEQMRLKDEKIEGYRWRLMSMELESKRLQSHIEGQNNDVSQLRHDNIRLEALLLEREKELSSLKQHIASQLIPYSCPKTFWNSSLHDPALTHDAVWSKFKTIKRRPIEEEQELKTSPSDKSSVKDVEMIEDIPSINESKIASYTVQSPENNSEDKRDIAVQSCTQGESVSPEEVDKIEPLASSSQPLIKISNSSWRMDIHALGVSYKIKRLKQQLLMLERLTGKNGEDAQTDDNAANGFQLLMSFLNKQTSRYQSLQEKTDDLCRRMHETDLDINHGDSNTEKRKGDIKALEHFLEETFQLQRYIVVTGQKLVEVQSRIVSGFNDLPVELDNENVSFDKQKFADNTKTLFQEVQRGLEVRIARIIGDLEGPLACEGMIRWKR